MELYGHNKMRGFMRVNQLVTALIVAAFAATMFLTANKFVAAKTATDLMRFQIAKNSRLSYPD